MILLRINQRTRAQSKRYLSTGTSDKRDLIRKPYESFSDSALVRHKQRRNQKLQALKQEQPIVNNERKTNHSFEVRRSLSLKESSVAFQQSATVLHRQNRALRRNTAPLIKKLPSNTSNQPIVQRNHLKYGFVGITLLSLCSGTIYFFS